MRGLLLLIVLALAGCASQPNGPSVIVADAVPPSESMTEEQRVAYAKKMHLKLVTRSGQELFCQNDPLTGSHMQTPSRCYTAQELDDLQRQFETHNRYMYRAVTPSPAQGQGH